MKGILTERNLVAALFVSVLIIFSLAQKQTQKMEELFLNGQNTAIGRTMDKILKTDNAPVMTVQSPASSDKN